MNDIIEYLAKAEGDMLHRNKGEGDITSAYGIYRVAHPDANIFKYYDSVAESISIYERSNEWTTAEIAKIDEYTDKEKVRELAEDFYSNYLSGAHLEQFPKGCRLIMYSAYVNSPKLAWKAVQMSIRNMVNSKETFMNIQDVSIVDGAYGNKTRIALSNIKDVVYPLYLETLIISNMKTLYIRLANNNQDKYFKYLVGWDNRVSAMQSIR